MNRQTKPQQSWRARIMLLLVALLGLGTLLSVATASMGSAEVESESAKRSDVGDPAASASGLATPTPSIFGVEIHRGKVEETASKASEASVSWVRYNGIFWSEVEATQGVRDWSRLSAVEDELIALWSQPTAIEPVMVVRSTPSWAQKVPGSFCGPIHEDALDDFADFMGELVGRYSQPPYNIKYWELWNEPDVSPSLVPANHLFGCWGDENDPYYGGGYYAEMLERVYPAIKAANPDAQVLIGGLLLDCDPANPPPGKTCQPAKFLEGILRHTGASGASGASYFDIVAYHGYADWSNQPGQDWDFAHPSWQHRGGVVLGKLDFIRDLLEQYSVDKPIFMSEGGLMCRASNPDCPGDEFYSAQANYVVRLYTRGLANNLMGVAWYALDGPSWREGNLLDSNQNPHPAYDSLRFLATSLQGFTYAGSLSNGTLEGYRFSKGRREYQILWTNDDTPINHPLPADTQAVYNKLGQNITPTGKVIPVGFEPVIVEIRPASFPFYDGFESGTLGDSWSVNTTQQGVVRIDENAAYTGRYGILLEDSVRDEVYSRAALILAVDLAGQSAVELSFWWREFNDENHTGDGVFVSDDLGATWHPVLSFNNGFNEYRYESIYLDEVAAANGLTLNEHFQIKFQFYDNHPTPSDGYALDEVRVEPRDPLVTPSPTPIPTDDYEADDSCGQAGTIATDGSIQEHTFHDMGDEDWVTIEASTTITYVIEARVPPGSRADIVLEVHESCNNENIKDQDYHFAADVRLFFNPPADGTYYLRLRNHDETLYGSDVAYSLSVRDPQTSAGAGALILVAGKLRENDPVQDNIYQVTDAVYDFALKYGCTAEQVYYLAPDMSLDANGDGQPDVDKLANNANLEEAITSWAADKVGAQEPLTIYMMDHGDQNQLYLNGRDEPLTATLLDGWLAQLEGEVPDLQTNVIVEACYSGSFVSEPESISQPNRTVMASTGDFSLAYASQEGAVFSDAFLDALTRGMNLQAAFDEGAGAAGLSHPDQTAWLDDDGDGTYGSDDGQVAAQRGFACAAPVVELWAPYIVEGEALLDGRISAEVRDDKAVHSVWAVVYPPSYTQPDDSEEMISEPDPVMLEAQGNDRYSGTYDSFDEVGTYRIVLYADDADDLTSRPLEVRLVELPPDQREYKLYLPTIIR
ncbi:MAG: C13 family peptidase [Ardenticatenaceae bacterium]